MPHDVQFATVLGSHQAFSLFGPRHPVPSPTSGAFAAQSALWVELNHIKFVTTNVGSGHGGVAVVDDAVELVVVTLVEVFESVVVDLDVVLVLVVILDEVVVESFAEVVDVLNAEVDLVDVEVDVVELDKDKLVHETSKKAYGLSETDSRLPDTATEYKLHSLLPIEKLLQFESFLHSTKHPSNVACLPWKPPCILSYPFAPQMTPELVPVAAAAEKATAADNARIDCFIVIESC